LNYKLFDENSTAINNYFFRIFERSFLLWKLLPFNLLHSKLTAQLQKEVESTSSKLDNAVKMAAEACQNVDSLKDELEQLRKKLKDEEAPKAAAEAEKSEKDNLLRQSILALLNNSHRFNF
jgi:gas vesicle protein